MMQEGGAERLVVRVHFCQVGASEGSRRRGAPRVALLGLGRFVPLVPISRLGAPGEAYDTVYIVVLAGGWMPLHYEVRREQVSGFDLESKSFTCKFI